MRSPRIALASSAVAFAFLAAAAGGLTASAASTPTPAAAGGMAAHPAHIHDGTCAKLGAVKYPLTDVAAPKKGATPTPSKETIATSTTKVKASLKDLEKAPFAINVHESSAKIQNYIACGDITGTAKSGKLTVTLKELKKSGVEGDAILTDNGDGTTTVVVELTTAKAAGATATPKA
ncbi:MAG: hypothetical protein ACR2OO_05295 [Thermomicrobiales bacterium]